MASFIPAEEREKSGASPTKKSKIEETDLSDASCIKLDSLERVKFVKILWNDVNAKTIYIQGKYSDEKMIDKDVVIKLEKSTFDDHTVERFLSKSTKLKQSFQNDIYSQYDAIADPELNFLKAVTILPATKKHIRKYTQQEFFLIPESPQDYAEITLPHIKENQHSLQWVYNILDHKAEADRIIYEDNDPEVGFLLLPDLKWNEKQLADLHLTAIATRRGICSLRDLTKDHLPLLMNILIKGKEAAQKKYGVNPDQLRIFLHYHPSYYHLHVHFLSVSSITGSCVIGKAHFLEDIIDNIESIDEHFYKKKTITFILGDQDSLLKKFMDAGKVRENPLHQ